MEAIVTNSLSRSFGQRKAVDNVSLTVHEGEFFSLLGVNGAGKTTLIRMLCCLCAPTSGSAQVLGQGAARVVFLFQHPRPPGGTIVCPFFHRRIGPGVKGRGSSSRARHPPRRAARWRG